MRGRRTIWNRDATAPLPEAAGLGVVALSMLMEIFLRLLYAAENIIRLLAGNQLDVPRTVPRKPSQPEEFQPAHFVTLGAHAHSFAAQPLIIMAKTQCYLDITAQTLS